MLLNNGYFYLRRQNWQNIQISKYIQETIKAPEEEAVKSLKRFGEKRIYELEKYISNRPDFAFVDWMKFEISYWNAYIGKYSNSYKIANELY